VYVPLAGEVWMLEGEKNENVAEMRNHVVRFLLFFFFFFFWVFKISLRFSVSHCRYTP
jgi:hypothetical protein